MIKGIGASDGIAIGRIFKYRQIEIVVVKREGCNPENEKSILDESLKKSIGELEALKLHTETNVDAETAAIFGAHIEILGDPELLGAVHSMIDEDKVNADFAMKSVSDSFVAIFEAMDNDYIRERAADIKDVSRRVLMHLQGLKPSSLSDIKEEVVLLAKDLTPSDTALLNKTLVKGFITNVGGRTSHSAIMARTLEIPAVVGTITGYEDLEDGDMVIMNGGLGEIIVNPTDGEIAEYKEKIALAQKEKALWQAYKNKHSETKDGKGIEITGNIGNPEDAIGVLEHDGDGVGLYRTEFLYMGQSKFPSEELQFQSYKSVLEKMGDKVVIVRTLDIGGDKELDYFKMDEEMNPFLGNRAIRLCLLNKEMFKVQLRALLRASVYGNLHIMFPMIATIDEFREVKSFLKTVEAELVAEGVEVNENYKLGIMIEIPAAALASDIFAKEVDFFSIGTNDLIQYTFAADRMNENVSYLYQPFNPSLLRLISMVTKAAHKENKWVGMCGEMAGEALALPLLIGLGLDELSMSAPSILRTRYMMAKIDLKEAEALVENALVASNEEGVLDLVNTFMSKLT